MPFINRQQTHVSWLNAHVKVMSCSLNLHFTKCTTMNGVGNEHRDADMLVSSIENGID